MSGYKSFAIIGSASISKNIIEALIEKKDAGVISSVSLLTRSPGGHDDLVSKGVKRVTVDYTSSSSIKAAFVDVDVVISTISTNVLGLQEELATSAKAAGVKLFVPSELGNPTDGATENFFGEKDGMKSKLKEIGIPYGVFYTGPGLTGTLGCEQGLSEMTYLAERFIRNTAKAFGFDFANGKADIHGSGTADISFSSQRDIARFIAHALTVLPKDKIEWRIFRIEAERTNLNQIVADWEAHTGKRMTVTYRPRSEFEEAAAKNPNDLVAVLSVEWDMGKGAVGKPEELANGEWPEWNPKKVIDTLIEIYGRI